MKTQSGIYQIINTVNGKRYVGSAKNFHVRSSKHFSALSLGKHHCRHLQSAYNKYGADRFMVNRLLVCAPEDLIFFEQRAIDIIRPEYNTSPTAGNTLGVRCSPERRRKISEAHKGKVLSEEHKQSIALGGMGRTPTEETRVKLCKAAQRRAEDPVWRRKVSEGKTGVRLTQEHKDNLSAAKKGVPVNLSEEMRLIKNAKIGEANRTRTISDNMRKNMSAAGRNKKGVVKLSYHGDMRTMLELSEISGLSKTTLRHRMNVMKWSVEDAVDRPSRKAI